MPIYEYDCLRCGARFDHLQRLSDPDLTHCLRCADAGPVQRRISAPAFRLKGAGWYETDFKTDKDVKRNLADSGDAKPTDAKPTDPKPADIKSGDTKPSDAKPAGGGAAAAPMTTPSAAPSGGAS